MLGKLRLEVDVDAVLEGTAVFPSEPLVRVTGPLLQCQLLESALLNHINFPTLIATKAARVRLAAGSDKVFEFGMRRAQGADGALTASRAAYVGGCDATSHVLAGKIFGIPVQGTHAHSWIMAFEEEETSFEQYGEVFPEQPIFLVDTYNTIEGVKAAIRVGTLLRARGFELGGVRLDSGDLAALSIETRKLLDTAGFPKALIVASNELDEVIISELKHQGAQIDVWGVGTNLVTAKDQPALDGVYKISALEDGTGKLRYILKLSEQTPKISNPGVLDVMRVSEGGKMVGDLIFDTLLGGQDLTAETLLQPIVRSGKVIYTTPPLQVLRQTTLETLSKLPSGVKKLVNPQPYPVAMEKHLSTLKGNLIESIRGKKNGS